MTSCFRLVAIKAEHNYYSLDLKCPPKALMALVGGGGTFRRWCLMEESSFTGNIPFKRILETCPQGTFPSRGYWKPVLFPFFFFFFFAS
jgi:hypothetical protein